MHKNNNNLRNNFLIVIWIQEWCITHAISVCEELYIYSNNYTHKKTGLTFFINVIFIIFIFIPVVFFSSGSGEIYIHPKSTQPPPPIDRVFFFWFHRELKIIPFSFFGFLCIYICCYIYHLQIPTTDRQVSDECII